MDSRLKQRLIGAAVLVALAVIFLPMLVQGPAPDSGVSNVPLSMPDAPRGAYETRDLPLVTPGDAPDGGAVGMASNPAGVAASPATNVPPVNPTSDDVPAGATPLGAPAADDKPATPAAASNPASAGKGDMFPPATAGGDYAVSFGTYGTTAAADAVVGSLRASQLPGYRESAAVNGKPAWRVRIGPYASRAQAEAARLRAAHVRDDVGARVVVLDAQTPATPAASTPATASASTAAKPTAVAAPPPPPPAATSAAASVGFAVQLAAFSKPADASALRDRLRAAGFNAFVESVSTDRGTLTRVRAGPVQSRAEADQLRAQIKSKLGLDGVVRPHP
jgi:cell division septation protein DedD